MSASEQIQEAPNGGTEGVEAPAAAGQSWKTIGVAVVVSSLISASALAAYHMLFRNTGRLATADLAEIVKIREIQFTNLVNKPNVTDRERMEAWNLVNRIGPEIEKALEEVQQECNCTLMVKSAFLAGPQEDMTEILKARLGLSGLSSKALMGAMPSPGSQGVNPAPGAAPVAGGVN